MKSHNMRFCFSNAHEFMRLSVVWFVTCCNFIELTTVIKWASVSLSVSAVCDEQVDWCGELYSCYSLGNCGCAMCGSFYNCIWVSERSSESSEVTAWVQCSWFTTILQRFCVLASCRTWWCVIRRPTFLKDAKDKARGQNQLMAIPGDVQVRLQCPLWHHKNHHQKLQKGWHCASKGWINWSDFWRVHGQTILLSEIYFIFHAVHSFTHSFLEILVIWGDLIWKKWSVVLFSCFEEGSGLLPHIPLVVYQVKKL